MISHTAILKPWKFMQEVASYRLLAPGMTLKEHEDGVHSALSKANNNLVINVLRQYLNRELTQADFEDVEHFYKDGANDTHNYQLIHKGNDLGRVNIEIEEGKFTVTFIPNAGNL